MSTPKSTEMRHSIDMKNLDFELRHDYIPLDALLKATGIAPSGGVAKLMVADGLVSVDGQQELRKTCKIRAGQVVVSQGVSIHVHASSADGAP